MNHEFWRPAVHALPQLGEGVKVGCDIIEDEPYLERGRSWLHVIQSCTKLCTTWIVKFPPDAAVRSAPVRNSDDET